jgi:hypothetical protein
MSTVNELAKQLKKSSGEIYATAKGFGFTGSITDRLPEDIADAIQSGTCPKQLGAAPQKNQGGNFTKTGENSKGQGTGNEDHTPENTYSAFAYSNSQLSSQLRETEKLAAQTQGAMDAHAYYANYLAARNAVLQNLMGARAESVTTDTQAAISGHNIEQSDLRTKAIMAVATSDKTGKTLKQVQHEILSVRNQLLPGGF